MKASFAFWLSVVCAASFASPAFSQFGGRASALGGSLAPQGARAHPLGGVISGGPGLGINRGFRGTQPGLGRRGRDRDYPYGFSFYVPNYFDYSDPGAYGDPNYGAGSYYGAPPAPYPAEAAPPSAPPPPVIINQYFGMQAPPPPQENRPEGISGAQAPGVPLGSVENYYLIAYKNHAIYSALSYWFEDKTLHYLTTQNTHNQASLDLIDVDLTKSLNRERDVPFSIPEN